MTAMKSHYIPALSLNWLTPLYDPLLKWGMREEAFKGQLIQRAHVRPGERVLDLGCGTGTLTLMLKQAEPGARVTGLDGDLKVLGIARAKASRIGLSIQWDHGMAYDLQYADGSFDVVVSSLVMHHLNTEDKLRAFREVARILRPGGRFHMLDFGRPTSLPTRLSSAVMMHLEAAEDNLRGRILPMLKSAGFAGATEARSFNTIFGTIWFYEARTSIR